MAALLLYGSPTFLFRVVRGKIHNSGKKLPQGNTPEVAEIQRGGSDPKCLKNPDECGEGDTFPSFYLGNLSLLNPHSLSELLLCETLPFTSLPDSNSNKIIISLLFDIRLKLLSLWSACFTNIFLKYFLVSRCFHFLS